MIHVSNNSLLPQLAKLSFLGLEKDNYIIFIPYLILLVDSHHERDMNWVVPLPSNSGKWRFIGIPDPKHETILVVTSNLGRGTTQDMNSKKKNNTTQNVFFDFGVYHTSNINGLTNEFPSRWRRPPVATLAELFLQVSSWHLGGCIHVLPKSWLNIT